LQRCLAERVAVLGVVLVAGRSLRGYEGFMAEAFAELGYDVVFVGYEDVWRSLYGGRPGWLSGILLRRLLVSRASREHIIGEHPVLRLYNRLVVELVERLEPVLVFVVKGEALSVSTIGRLGELVPERHLAYFNPDDPRYGLLVGIYAGAGFRVLTACHSCLVDLRSRYGRGNVYLLPFAAKPLPRFSCSIRVPMAVFVGSVYPERLRLVRGLLRRGIPVAVAGPGWRRFVPGANPEVYGTKYLALNRVAYVVLNIHNRSDIGAKANMRVFEVPGAGGVEATDNHPVVSRYFSPGRELFTYSDVEELSRLLRELLGWDPQELCIVAERAYNRARREHSYRSRAHRVLQVAGLSPGEGRGRVVSIRPAGRCGGPGGTYMCGMSGGLSGGTTGGP